MKRIIKRSKGSQIEQLEHELQQMVSDSKELDIRTKIENALDGMEISLSNGLKRKPVE